MRILLLTGACYLPTRGGSTRSNRAWLERLASRGHDCRVISALPAKLSESNFQQFEQEAEAEGISGLLKQGVPVSEINWNQVSVNLVRSHRITEQVEQTIQDFQPTCILVSSEDFGQILLRKAVRIAEEKTVYLAHTPQLFPFGPASLNPNVEGAKAVAAVAEIIAIGNYMRAYFETFISRRPLVVHPPIYGSGPFPNYGERNEGYITMVNPCAVKGISIFLGVAALCKSLQFAAVPGWGTTGMDLDSLLAADVKILPPCPDIDSVYKQTRILLVPSLWPEGFGLVVVEAMLRGIPVLSSNLGGLPEAKMGSGYIFNVQPIKNYSSKFDEQFLPIAEVPEQDLGPWCSAIDSLVRDPEVYSEASRKAKNIGQQFVDQLNPDKLEHILETLSQKKAMSIRV